ncbi:MULTISPECIES: PhzF family phenazine biosynthesis isomerase [Mammaliicoccus]|uniref:PhzF family phenazine biosynthesis protein n=1 Tax=Mammaliicoccus TaxID=2803850 RepID=UPI000D1D009B|nr:MULTISPECIES: PhzF family phenazine biosynthesis isomerase [Mammaliicoccus]MBW0765053.1 PhzF family phenazine biosynthesis isomerase [Mammaliicoccus fleurettii]MEB7806684.1 PhzF family phenazine biosynthesis isomerase [Mammaliicoccus fleurettii]PTE31613.1 phenazine biosynthesis protein PhzF [Mammaliicoccus fleurettii]
MNIYHTDVFLYNNEGGNPCPVILDADDLSFDAMINVAKEYNVEVGFVLKNSDATCDYQFKYFVPKREMEMCVHATIACVTILKKEGLLNKDHLLVETLSGTLSIDIIGDDSDFKVQVKQGEAKVSSQIIDKSAIAKALNISENEVSNNPIKNVSTSRFKTIIELNELETLNNLNPQFDYLWEVCVQIGSTGFYPFVRVDEGIYHARQFPNNNGYNEDPATGVAASALGIYIEQVLNHKYDEITIYQGFAMNRPSKILVAPNGNTNSVVGQAVIR